MLYSKFQEYYYIFLVLNLKTHYLCSPKVKDEIGPAGEQPNSNTLSALYNKRKGDGILLSLFYFTGIALWSKKTQFYQFSSEVYSNINPTKTTFYQWTKPQIPVSVK
ncbi:MAG: hypothetical protein PHS59_03185 [Paludibacter sp.]|nr:hypothetical protein [Paludibacter sp.]